jgi:hypothetical protein
MKKEKDKDLDDLFKSNLADPVYNSDYLEDDWDALEQMLDKPKKRPAIVFWLPILSSAAALLIFFGWLLFKPQVVKNDHQKQQATIILEQATSGLNPVASNNKANENRGIVSPGVGQVAAGTHTVVQGSTNRIITKALATYSYTNTKVHGISTGTSAGNNKNNSAVNTPGVNEINNGAVIETRDNVRPAVTLVAVNSNSLLDEATNNNQRVVLAAIDSKDIVRNPYQPDLIKNDKGNNNGLTKLGFVKHPQLALTFIGASELNGANSLGDAKSGTNVGLLFSAGIFNRLTVTTGANYSVKPYNTDIANYHTNYTFKTNPTQIEADCRVLDIPINIDYQLYNKHKNKFSIGTGLSSYIMMHESYQYYYADPTTKGPVAFTAPPSGKYFFGIMNLQASYQRQVNSKFGLSITPYLKLPLTSIGYSQVRLQTAGVAVGLNWNINSLTKP